MGQISTEIQTQRSINRLGKRKIKRERERERDMRLQRQREREGDRESR